MADVSTFDEAVERLVPRAGTKYVDLAAELQSRIHAGTISYRVPSIPELCEEFGTSPMTAQKALSFLREQGIVRSEVGNGTFITRLKRKRTHTIGVVVHTLSHQAPLHSRLVSALHDRAHEIDETIVAKAHDGDSELELIHVRQLVEQTQVDGLILWSANQDRATIDYLKHQGLPFVLVPEPDLRAYSNCCTVSADDAGAAAKLMEHLLATGRTRIGFVSGSDMAESPAFAARYEQYVASVRHAGLKPSDPLLVEGDYTRSELELAPGEAERISDFDAVFAVTDGYAGAVLTACLERGIRVPADLAVAGYDNSILAEVLKLTSVEQHFEQIGRKAVDVLMDDIEERRSEPVHEVVESELVVRRSTRGKAEIVEAAAKNQVGSSGALQSATPKTAKRKAGAP